MEYKTIAGTGHRPDKLSPGGYKTYWDRDLPRLVTMAEAIIRHHQAETVISGMAQGWDTALAKAAIALQVPLICAIPGPWFSNRWPDTVKDAYHAILVQATEVHYMTEEDYSPKWMNVRNQWMTDRVMEDSGAMVALWNGTPGGTANNICYAESVNCPVHNYWQCWVNRRGF